MACVSIYIYIYRVTKKTEPINFFITSTKIKQNNSNFVHFWTCWWILWSQFFMHRIYFISWKKRKGKKYIYEFQSKIYGFCWGFFLQGGSPSIYRYIYTCEYLSMYIYMYGCIMWLYIMWVSLCALYIYMHQNSDTKKMYMCIRVDIHMCFYIYIYTHTHTHTQTSI